MQINDMDYALEYSWRQVSVFTVLIYTALVIIGLCSTVVTLERVIAYRSARENSRKFFYKTILSILSDQFETMTTYATDFSSSPLSKVMLAVLQVRQSCSGAVSQVLELCSRARRYALDEVEEDLSKGLHALKRAAIFSFHLGALGTLIGILDSFRVFKYGYSGSHGAMDYFLQSVLSSFNIGLFSLLIAATSMYFHERFSADAKKIYIDVEYSSLELLNCLNQQDEIRTRMTQIHLSSNQIVSDSAEMESSFNFR